MYAVLSKNVEIGGIAAPFGKNRRFRLTFAAVFDIIEKAADAERPAV